MSTSKSNAKSSDADQKIDVDFESHPPIESDLEGIATLLKQTILHYADCSSLARYLISLKDLTQIIALEGQDEENISDEDEPDDNIYGVISTIDISANFKNDQVEVESRKDLTKFLKEKSQHVKDLLEQQAQDDKKIKLTVIVNERYINLPAQLSLPTLKNLTNHLKSAEYTHLIFISKVLLRSRQTNTELPSKKSKSSSSDEPIIYVNAEEEIIFENCEHHNDVDVSSFCDENASWLSGSDVKYIPHRRIMLIDFKKWPKIMENLEKEL